MFESTDLSQLTSDKTRKWEIPAKLSGIRDEVQVPKNLTTGIAK